MTRMSRVLARLGVVALLLSSATLGSCAQAQLPVDISTHGHAIDHLFWVIMWLTGLTFVGTEALLIYVIFKFRNSGKAQHVHGNHLVEMVWTIVPGIILFFLAIYQLSAWHVAKVDEPPDADCQHVRVFAKQFEWHYQYAGPDGRFDTKDDVYSIGDFVIQVNKPVKMQMRSRDVLHSFYIPVLRFKQDLVPGKNIVQWVTATETTAEGRAHRARYTTGDEWKNYNYEVACAELCGLGHGKMRSIMTILDEAEFNAWLAERSKYFHKDTGDGEAPSLWLEQGGWVSARTIDDPDKMYRQAGKGEKGYKAPKNKEGQ